MVLHLCIRMYNGSFRLETQNLGLGLDLGHVGVDFET